MPSTVEPHLSKPHLSKLDGTDPSFEMFGYVKQYIFNGHNCELYLMHSKKLGLDNQSIWISGGWICEVPLYISVVTIAEVVIFPRDDIPLVKFSETESSQVKSGSDGMLFPHPRGLS